MGCRNTLIYKRTHRGDPDKSGVFGVHDCMGQVRGWSFDAVIGIGGESPRADHKDIAHKINWIGMDPKKTKTGKRGPHVTFKYFCLYEEKGQDLKTRAPKLFKYMFRDKNVRVVMSRSLPCNIQKEITKILRGAEKCPKSKGLLSRKQSQVKCK